MEAGAIKLEGESTTQLRNDIRVKLERSSTHIAKFLANKIYLFYVSLIERNMHFHLFLRNPRECRYVECFCSVGHSSKIPQMETLYSSHESLADEDGVSSTDIVWACCRECFYISRSVCATSIDGARARSDQGYCRSGSHPEWRDNTHRHRAGRFDTARARRSPADVARPNRCDRADELLCQGRWWAQGSYEPLSCRDDREVAL